MSFVRDMFGGAERDASAARTEGYDNATAEGRRQHEQNREDFAPYIERGNAAGDRYNDFLGLNGQEAEQSAISGFNESPGQAFLRQRQERALTRNSAAIGGLGGGNVRTALQEQAFGIANTQLGERKDRLAGVSGLGASATANQAQIGAGISSNISNSQIGRGNARASGILGSNAAIMGGLSRIGGVFTGSGGKFQNPWGGGQEKNEWPQG